MTETKSKNETLADIIMLPFYLAFFAAALGVLWLACHALKYIVLWLFGI